MPELTFFLNGRRVIPTVPCTIVQQTVVARSWNLNQNPRTLLPKFFGLYCYQCNSKNVRLVSMNNLLPSSVKLHQKYDLKGSTYKRKASKSEKSKRSPTYKDLDFMEHHAEGILLESDTYNALIKTIQRDCRVLESFKIMDYSLLLGIHNLDQAVKENTEQKVANTCEEGSDSGPDSGGSALRGRDMEDHVEAVTVLNRSRSMNRHKLVAHSTALESIQADSQPIDHEDNVPDAVGWKKLERHGHFYPREATHKWCWLP
ncbi:hypothetical protein QAD02_021879 [Eretmocerus hayati]|uniref:Uncharacterized protein n=1 Tax=Eretmocerus hayati TaxID=131215 RepID=A0ACC2PWA3_9HYME|nr:hypothetical protein QAD02_021879 [Eretmocerus hayati]